MASEEGMVRRTGEQSGTEEPVAPSATSQVRRGSSLRVLVTNITLAGRSGTETFTRDLVLGLHAAGHRPIVYAGALGPIAAEIARHGIPVTDRFERIAGEVDIIHGHHSTPTAVAVARFPATPAVFVCHDATAWHDAPPDLPSIRRFFAVARRNADRLACGCGVPPERIVPSANPVDTERFAPGPALPDRPLKAIAVARGTTFVDPVERACARAGVAVTIVGPGVGAVVQRPEAVLPGFDLVPASGRSALEGTATGRAVIVCDDRGLAGVVTPDRFERWLPDNFGLGCLDRALDPERDQGRTSHPADRR